MKFLLLQDSRRFMGRQLEITIVCIPWYPSVCSEFNFTWTFRLPSMLLLKLPCGISSKCNYYKIYILSNCFGVNYIHFICRLEGIHDKCMDPELKPTLIYPQHKSSLLCFLPVRGNTDLLESLPSLLNWIRLKLKTIHKYFLCPYKRQRSMLCFISFKFSGLQVKHVIGKALSLTLPIYC